MIYAQASNTIFTPQQSCKRVSFWSRNPARNQKPKPCPSPSLLKHDLGPKAKLTGWVKKCATVGCLNVVYG